MSASPRSRVLERRVDVALIPTSPRDAEGELRKGFPRSVYAIETGSFDASNEIEEKMTPVRKSVNRTVMGP